MKGGLAAQLTVLRRFKEENASFDADIEFVGLSDEERHSIGAHAYVKLMQQQNALRKKNFFLMGEPHFDNIVLGATGKALLSLRIQVSMRSTAWLAFLRRFKKNICHYMPMVCVLPTAV